MPYTIRYNARTAHLEGIAERTTGPATDNSATTGVVAYYAQSACAALTRSGSRMAVSGTMESLADGLTVLRDFAEARGLKVCANCERAAVAALETDYDVAELKAREAARQLDAAENFEDEPRIAIAEEHAERLADEYADLAAVIGRCRIFGCEAPAHESSAWCEEHTDQDDTEDTASAIEAETTARHEADNAARMIAAVEHDDTECPERTTVDGIDSPCVNVGEHVEHNTERGAAWWTPVGPELAAAAAGRASTQGKPYTPTGESYSGCEARIYHNGVGSPCARPRGHEGPGSTSHRTTTGIEWMPGQTRPSHCPYARTTTGCDDCKEHAALVDRLMESGQAKTYSEAEALAVAMEEEPDAVTARLDHTETGKAIAIIDGGHGREAAPQAWLAHEGGSWLLVDDYDGDTLNVKGPDAERAVHAWAALLGLRIDALTVEVEYAGGPVSPPVREPEDRAPVTLEWVLVGDDDGAPVFEARGRAHTYRVTKHASGYAPLVATLRGANVETHRRSYASVANARKAGQDYETRYATIYAPAE